MNRDVFTRELIQRQENVRQKELRLLLALAIVTIEGSNRERELAFVEARNNLHAARQELADFLYDSMHPDKARR